MREILFKAKRINWYDLPEEQHWVTGYYWTNGLENHFIRVTFENDEFTIKDYEIDLNTLCQYTNMNDEFDDKIFENDYVKFEDVGEEGYEYKEGFDFDNVAKVVFCNGRWELDNFGEYNSGVYEEINDHYELFTTLIHSKVIGNAFDNPELESDEDYIDDYEINYLLDFLGIDYDKYSWFE